MVFANEISFSVSDGNLNLYQAILSNNGVTQLPQRADLGDLIFPSVVASVSFLLPNNNQNSGKFVDVMDENSDLITVLIPAIPYTIGSGNINNIDLTAILVATGGLTVNLSVSVVAI